MAVSAGLMLPDTTLSRASPLPQVSAVNAKFAFSTNHCGSGLAREEALTDNP